MMFRYFPCFCFSMISIIIVCGAPAGNSGGWFAHSKPPFPSSYKKLSSDVIQKTQSLYDESIKAVDLRRLSLEKEAKQLAKQANLAARQIGTKYKDRVLRDVQTKRNQLEQQLQLLTEQAENLTRQKVAAAVETLARTKLAKLKAVAKEAGNLASRGGAQAFLDNLVGSLSPEPLPPPTPPQQQKSLLPKWTATVIMNVLLGMVLVSAAENLSSAVVELQEEIQDFSNFEELLSSLLTNNNLPILVVGMLKLEGFLLLAGVPGAASFTSGALVLVAALFGRESFMKYYNNEERFAVPAAIASLAGLCLMNDAYATVLQLRGE